jgi:uncharacterized NTF2-like protein DUF6841
MNDNQIHLTTSVNDDVTSWFFDDYLPTWVGVAAGTIARGPEFILDYWAAPLHFSTDEGGQWLHDAPAVVQFLEETQSRLRADGYAHTNVPDHGVSVYHDNGAAIEVIWSRCRADNTEIERLAAHFELSRNEEGWRIVGIQISSTAADTLSEAWTSTPTPRRLS